MLTLNLLPSQEKEALKIIKIRNLAIFYGIRILSLFLLAIILLLNVYLFLFIQLRATTKLAAVEKSNLAEAVTRRTEQDINTINRQLADLDAAYKDRLALSAILVDLAKIAPPEVQFRRFSFNDDTKKSALEGFAAGREQVVALKESLDQCGDFSEVESPASNLIKPKDIEFRFNFLIGGK